MYRNVFRRLRAGKNVHLERSQQRCSSKASRISRTNHELIRPVAHLFHPASILVSTASSIIDNLCLEEWIYRNYDFADRQELILLLWRNRPAVVIGRHQNLWSECALQFCRSAGIEVARRNSGGGTVYHDRQNLNLSFMSSRSRYDRGRNLAFLARLLREEFHIDTMINAREDLVLERSGEKVSGTASKLSANNAYHHCTLLVDVDANRLRESLRKRPILGYSSNATKSVPSPVLNLRRLNGRLSIDSLIYHLNARFGAMSLQDDDASENVEIDRNLHYVDPTDTNLFGGIDSIYAQFSSWNWIYGKSPKFSLTTFALFDGRSIPLEVVLEKGHIIALNVHHHNDDNSVLQPNLELTLKRHMIGTRFEEADLMASLQAFQYTEDEQRNTLKHSVSIAIWNAYKQCLC